MGLRNILSFDSMRRKYLWVLLEVSIFWTVAVLICLHTNWQKQLKWRFIMSRLGYFMGGTAAGLVGITIAALLHDKFCTSEASTAKTDSASSSAGGDLASSLADLKKNMKEINELFGCNEQSQSPEHLQESFTLLTEKHTFKPGDVVQWKQGMKNKRTKGPFVVVETLKTPVFDNDKSGGSGSQYFREPLDIILGSTNSDGEFLTYHYDSRRFQAYSANQDSEGKESVLGPDEGTAVGDEAPATAGNKEACTA